MTFNGAETNRINNNNNDADEFAGNDDNCSVKKNWY